MANLPINWDVLSDAQKSVVINRMYSALIYQSPILNMNDLGAAQPASAFLRDGFDAYANGSDWNPGTMGAGEYVYESDWRKLQYCAYGELCATDGTAASINNAASGTLVYSTLLNLEDCEAYFCTLDGTTGKITFNVSGKFRICLSISFSVDKNGKAHGDVFHNGVEVTKMAFSRTITTTGVGVAAVTGILDVAAGDSIVFKMRHSALNSVITLDHFNMNATQIA